MHDLAGVILAGGLSRRMGGTEKSLLQLGDLPLIGHVALRLQKTIKSVVINANGKHDRFTSLNLPVVGDTVEGFAGPLAGVLAGMRWAAVNTSACYVITAAADTPFFPDTYSETMWQTAKQSGADIVLASSNGRKHPVFGLWNIALADQLEEFLVEEENRKVMLFVERYKFQIAEFEETGFDPFFNVNTPDDMKRAEQIFLELGTG